MIAVNNSSLGIEHAPKHQHLKFLINICGLLSAIFAIVVSVLIIDYIAVNVLRKRRSKKTWNISLLLTCNTGLAIVCASSTLTIMILSSIGGDLNIYGLKRLIDWGCHIRGYLHFVFINSIYLSYVLQAGFRLFRIAFHEYRCLRTIYSFFVYIITQWSASFLLILPILIARTDQSSLIVYLPEEYYCQVPMTSIRGIVFSILSVYFVPLCFISLIYLWIIMYIRRSNRQFMLAGTSIRRRNKRDAIIIKRICVIIVVLLFLGVPSCLFVISFIITGHLNWAAYRVGWMTISISFALISLSSVYVTPQIYKPVRVIFNHTKNSRKSTNSSSTNNNNNIEMQTTNERFLSKQSVSTNTIE